MLIIIRGLTIGGSSTLCFSKTMYFQKIALGFAQFWERGVLVYYVFVYIHTFLEVVERIMGSTGNIIQTVIESS